jgi:hypothetical protein
MDFKGLSAELMFLKIYRKTGVKWSNAMENTKVL